MRKYAIFLLLFAVHTTICMKRTDLTRKERDQKHVNVELIPDVCTAILTILIHPTLILTISDPNGPEQRELICHILNISKLNKKAHTYINSYDFIQGLLRALPYNAKYPFCCRMISKSLEKSEFDDDEYQMFAESMEKKVVAQTASAIEYYFLLAYTFCSNIHILDIEAIKTFLDVHKIDPNFYIDSTDISHNRPPALYHLAVSETPESLEKLGLLLSCGADVNIQYTSPFTLHFPAEEDEEPAHQDWGYDEIRDNFEPRDATPLLIALKNENEPAVIEILKHNPQLLHIEQAFYADTNIKDCIIRHRVLTPKEINQGLKGALIAYDIEDVTFLLTQQADPSLYLEKTVKRIVENCLPPTKEIPAHWLPLSPPSTKVVKALCDYGAYNEQVLNNLKNLQHITTKMVKMLETNKPTQ